MAHELTTHDRLRLKTGRENKSVSLLKRARCGSERVNQLVIISGWESDIRRRRRRTAKDHVSGLFCDHDRCRIGVCADD